MMLLLPVLLIGALADEEAGTRFVLAVGNNVGSTALPGLRYAERDAEQMRRLLSGLGGATHTELVLGGSVTALDRAFERIDALIAERASPATLVFYYSGHADESGLLLDGERYHYSRLRDRLRSSKARLFVAMIDACSSGSLGRAKGGTAIPVVNPFAEDQRYQGGVFITSSSGGERSQESDEIESSVFTHYLVTGMRGAADESGDGRVSLDEAYQYAYRNTVARTGTTLLGPQHPTYDVSMYGRGQLIMTWLGRASASLVLPENARGVFVLRSADGLAANVLKVAGRPMRLALEPGGYQLSREEAGEVWAARIELSEGEERLVVDGQMRLVRGASGGAPKGGGPVVQLAAAYVLRSGFLEDGGALHGADLALRDVARAPLDLELGVIAGYRTASYRRREGFLVAAQLLDLRVAARRAWWLSDPVSVVLGFETGAGWISQRAEGGGLAAQSRASLFMPGDAAVGLELRFFDRILITVEALLGVVAYMEAEGVTSRLSAGLRAGIGLGL